VKTKEDIINKSVDEIWTAIQRPHPPVTRDEILAIFTSGIDRVSSVRESWIKNGTNSDPRKIYEKYYKGIKSYGFNSQDISYISKDQNN
jgi:hypothetical protein